MKIMSKSWGNISDWLGKLDLPKMNDAAREALNSDITIEEFSKAIKSFPHGKSPGSDGFGIELYKKIL